MSKNNVVEENKKIDSKKNVTKQEKPKKKTDEKRTQDFKRKANDAVGELKKVTWPSFGTIVKKTSTVLLFCGIALVFLFAVDFLLRFLVSLIG